MWNINVEPEGEAEKCELLYRINYQSLYIHKKHAAYFELATDNCSSLQKKKKKEKRKIVLKLMILNLSSTFTLQDQSQLSIPCR